VKTGGKEDAYGGLLKEFNMGCELAQSTLYTLTKLSQWNSLVLLMYANKHSLFRTTEFCSMVIISKTMIS
jgi:hypothetical protein